MGDVNRAQLIETIRMARTILDTAWPASEELLGTEPRMGESMVRAQIGVVVTGYLLQEMQGAAPPQVEIGPFEAAMAELMLALREQSKSDQELRTMMRRQQELFNGAVDALDALHRIILERLPMAPEPTELPQKGPKGTTGD